MSCSALRGCFARRRRNSRRVSSLDAARYICYFPSMAKRFQNPGGGPSQRQQRVGENIRRALADILMRGETHDPDLGRRSITVSEVKCSPDLKRVTAYVLPLGGDDPEGAIALLKKNAGTLRRLLGRAVHLKYAPEIHFVIDETFDRMDDARRMLDDERVRADVKKDEE